MEARSGPIIAFDADGKRYEIFGYTRRIPSRDSDQALARTTYAMKTGEPVEKLSDKEYRVIRTGISLHVR